MDGRGHSSAWERATREEAVGEPITLHVLTAQPLYRQPRGRGRGPLPTLSAHRGPTVMNGPPAPPAPPSPGTAGRGRHLVSVCGTAGRRPAGRKVDSGALALSAGLRKLPDSGRLGWEDREFNASVGILGLGCSCTPRPWTQCPRTQCPLGSSQSR